MITKNNGILVVLYTQEDITKYISSNLNEKNIFIFCPYDKKEFKNYRNINFYDNSKYEKLIQLKSLAVARKIYDKVIDKKNFINIDIGLIENIRNIFFVSFFSLFSISLSLNKFRNFKFKFFDGNSWKKYDDYDSFITNYLNNFLSKNLDFYSHFKPHKNNFYEKILNYLNQKILMFFKKKNIVLLSSQKKLYTKIINHNNTNNLYFIVINNKDFKLYHIIKNLLNLFRRSKKFFYYSPSNYNTSGEKLSYFFNKFFEHISTKETIYFEKNIKKILLNYCENQILLMNDLRNFLNIFKIKYIIVDQLRFDISTILSSIGKEKKIDIILVPHGSLSKPNNTVTKFMYSLCGQGMLFSELATHVISQTKISLDSINYYNQHSKVLKSKKIMFGEEELSKVQSSLNIKTFLHASTPKSLYKWPWIHETYSEYISNLKNIINVFERIPNIKLVIRFRPSPECNLKKFKELINLRKYNFIQISKNKKFIDDLSISDFLISFSSTVIEEAISFDKAVIIYSGNKDYKHINYPFMNKDSIYFLNKENFRSSISKIINEHKLSIKNNINWSNDDLLNGGLFSYLDTKNNCFDHKKTKNYD